MNRLFSSGALPSLLVILLSLGSYLRGDVKPKKSEDHLIYFEKVVASTDLRTTDPKVVRKLMSLLLYLGPNSPDIWNSDNQRARVAELRSVILPVIHSYPDHAQLLRTEILESKERVLAGKEAWGNFNRISGVSFILLKNIQSPESVAILAGFLDDTKGGTFEDRYPTQARNVLKSNALAAAISLYRMGLKDRPKSQFGDLDPEKYPEYPQEYFIDPWKEWWQEIVDGKRIFSFVGDRRQFNAQGLVAPLARTSGPEHPSKDKVDKAVASPIGKGLILLRILVGVFFIGSFALLAKRNC